MRQERILLGALTVFKAKGLEGATMDEIANESGFGKLPCITTLNPKRKCFQLFSKKGGRRFGTPSNP